MKGWTIQAQVQCTRTSYRSHMVKRSFPGSTSSSPICFLPELADFAANEKSNADHLLFRYAILVGYVYVSKSGADNGAATM